jgi:hypothetical protein
MSLKHVRLLLQHNHYDLVVPVDEIEVFEDILHKTLLAASEDEHRNLVCDLGNVNYSLKFKARHLTGWVIKDTPFDTKVA